MSSLTLVPRVSEKAIGLAEKGVFVFEVPTNANKLQVAAAVESTFKVNVTNVNMLVAKGKPTSKRLSKRPGNRANVKKAMVTLKSGQTINLFEGAK